MTLEDFPTNCGARMLSTEDHTKQLRITLKLDYKYTLSKVITLALAKIQRRRRAKY